MGTNSSIFIFHFSYIFMCQKKKKHENGKWVPEKKEKIKKIFVLKIIKCLKNK